MLRVSPMIHIPDGELEENFVRASGPGGQNVNKLSTAVELRFDVRGSESLPAWVKRRLERLAGNRLTNNGVLVIRAERQRTQARNRADARERLADLIRRAAVRPRTRKPTRPTRASVERRLKAKTRRGQTKKLRESPLE